MHIAAERRFGARVFFCYLPLCLTGALSACGGGSDGGSAGSAGSAGNPTYAISGTISGAVSSGLVLTDGSATVAPQPGAASFTFPTQLTTGTSYSVTVQSQPPGETCSVVSGSGTIGSSNITGVNVSCVTGGSAYSVGGTISGLSGGGLILANGTDMVSAAAGASTFTFPTLLTSGTAYSVTVQTQPTGQTCSVASGSGTEGSANNTSVAVSCVTNAGASTFSIGGTISGLTGTGLVLANAAGTVSPAVGASSFTFPTQLTTGTSYGVTVQTQPTGQTCTVASGLGTVASANITSVAVSCVTNTGTSTYSIGGTISGLSGTGLVLAGAAGTLSPAVGASSFTFPTQLATGTAYSVTVQTQPTGQTCSVASGSGTVGTANITSVTVSCVTNVAPSTYSIGGTISGLSGSGMVLASAAGTSSPSAGASSFTFPAQLTTGTAYSVTVQTQPTGQTCSVVNGSGTVGSSNIINIAVSCVTNTYSIGGTISGLTGNGLVLADGSGTVAAVAGATSFTFPTKLTSGAAYAVTVQAEPPGLNCQVSSGTGTVGTAAVTTVAVGCVSGQWAWIDGSTFDYASGVYGSQGVASAGNVPGARYQAASWTDSSGNLWLFSGSAVDAYGGHGRMNDLWKFNTNSLQWTWVGGSNIAPQNPSDGSVGYDGSNYGTQGVAAPDNIPGARSGAFSWTDPAGNFWLFGGATVANSYIERNDLWKYQPSNGEWTWVSGSTGTDLAGVYGTQGVAAAGNAPGSRKSGAAWTDAAGNLWLFGGDGFDSAANHQTLNDLWKFSPSNGMWTWISGSSIGNELAVYGTEGTAAAGNVPGARQESSSWTDPAGNLWLLGGYGPDPGPNSTNGYGDFNDLWKFSPSTGLWAWVSGSNVGDGAGVYGTQGVAAASNVPGARSAAGSWTDGAGDLWLVGGYARDAADNWLNCNDLWEYQPSTGLWTWVKGSTFGSPTGVYGTQGVASAGNAPGGRNAATTWIDSAGNLWLFGGVGYDSSGNYGLLNDLWMY